MVNDKEMAAISLIKSTSMKDNSKITIFTEKEEYLETKNYFLKENSKMDSNMEMANINIKIVTYSKEGIIKMKKEAGESIFLQKEEFSNHSLIQGLLKFLKYHYQMVQYMSDSNVMVHVKVKVKRHMLMVVHMKVNGKLIISMELGYFSILITLDMMGNSAMI